MSPQNATSSVDRGSPAMAARPAAWTRPMPVPVVVETPRLILRPWTHADAGQLLEAIEDGRASLLPWLPWAATDNRTIAECHYTIERFARDFAASGGSAYTSLVLGIFEKGTGRALGGTGFHDLKPGIHECEIGYWVRASARRRGICREAVEGWLTCLLSPQGGGAKPPGWGLRRAKIVCAATNTASQGVPRSLNLRQEARFRLDRYIEGHGWDDTLSFGVTAEEWAAR